MFFNFPYILCILTPHAFFTSIDRVPYMDTKMLACVCPGQRVSTQHHRREIPVILEEGKGLGLAFLWI